MKRMSRILIAVALPLFILVFGVTVAAAKGGDESIPWITTVGLSDDTIHLGGTVVATAGYTDDDPLPAIDWGDGMVEEWIVSDNNWIVTADHLYSEPGQYFVVVIVIMPDGSQKSASAALKVMTAHETIDWLIENVNTLVHDKGLTLAHGQSLINHLEDAQAALDEEDPEAVVEALRGYLDELTEYIEAGLVPKADRSPTIAGDLANVLLGLPDIY